MTHEFVRIGKNAIDLTGQRFERLTVLGPIAIVRRQVKWLCLCDCGKEVSIHSRHLRGKRSRSCGCLRVETTRKIKTLHGKAGSPIYETWINMIGRCEKVSNPRRVDWGGRGIKVDDVWRHDFQAFYDHVSSLEHFGEEGYSLDRINNDGNYEPGNIKWSTATEQARNTRHNKVIAHNGVSKCVTAWAEETGVSAKTLNTRLRAGWSVERALTTPIGKKGKE